MSENLADRLEGLGLYCLDTMQKVSTPVRATVAKETLHKVHFSTAFYYMVIAQIKENNRK